MNNNELVTTETGDSKSKMKVYLPNKLLECLPRISALPKERLRWSTNEEIASYLITFDKHEEWLSCTLKTRPQNGSIILYNRKKVKYRKDGYCWKKRKDGKTTREDHMKLKVQGMECLYGCYVHSSIVPTFHRRCYWLLQNPDIVLVHYLNVPCLEDSVKACGPTLSPLERADSLRWNRDELLAQLKPMFHSIKWACGVAGGGGGGGGGGKGLSDLSIEQLVQQILQSQQTKPQPRTHTCLCSTALVSSGANIPHRCNSTKHRIISPKLPPSSRPCRGADSPDPQPQPSPGGAQEAVPSPSPSSSSSSSSPPQPQRTGTTANGFYGDQRGGGGLATVALHQNAVIVMTTAAIGLGPRGEERSGLSLTHSGQLLLSPVLPKPSSPSPPTLASPAPPTLSLTLLPSPVIGGLLLASSSSSSSSSLLPPPQPPPASLPPPSPAPPVFDPDSFLNSPKQGQTYGGPLPPSSPSPPPSSSPQPPSLTLSLSPTSPPSSSSPPSSLSSLSSEAERKNGETEPPSSSSIPPSLSLSLSPPLPPLTLGQERRGGQEEREEGGEEEGHPPNKLALLQASHPTNVLSQQQTVNGTPLLLIRHITQAPPTPLQTAKQTQREQEGETPLVCDKPKEPLSSNRLPAAVAQSLYHKLQQSQTRERETESERETEMEGGMERERDVERGRLLSQLQQRLGQHESMRNALLFCKSTGSSAHANLSSFNQANANANLCSVNLANANANLTSAQASAANTSASAVHVKDERGRGFDTEDTPMDTHSEVEPDDRGEELEISFDSQFPDLIAELITEESNHVPPSGPAPPTGANHCPFSAGVRYMVPPQPSPSSSFLPFPTLQHSTEGGVGRLAAITDFSPEWSYPEGGVKVLITGPWSEVSGRYRCVFDQNTVPASLIQPGVLRCYCPAHEAGLVGLQVLEESSGSVSASVLFEYRARNTSSLPSSQLDWLSLDDNQFRMSILERLEQMERRMAEMAANNRQQQQQQQQQQGSRHATHTPPPMSGDSRQSAQWFERRIVGVCERMMEGGRWGGGGGRLLHSPRHRGMTLLHLAAAQGYTHLIHTLIHWRGVNSDSLYLEQEVDPLNVDHFSCTPLMWACALGHQRAAELLYGWNSHALGIPDSLGRLPLAVARSRGHTRLAQALEELHTRAPQAPPTPQATPPSPLSTSPDTGLSCSSSLPSPSNPPSPSPSSAYSSGSAPMDTSPSSPSLSSSSSPSSSLPLSPPSPSPLPMPPLPVWGESVCEGGASEVTSLEEELLDYSDNAENEEDYEEEVLQVDMATLAEEIIEATPERIKQEDFSQGAESPLRERQANDTMPWLATYLETVDTHTHSPPRCVCPPSPLSALALQRLRPPSSAAWAEFLNASTNGRMERDFALLTLTDSEQRELYEAARIIQNAFRRYKGRRLKEQQDMAAAVIQRCYRKYKQYALYKKMTQAAILIQSRFRSYYEQKRFQQSRRAAVLIQQYYRSYKEYERIKARGPGAHNPKLKGSFLTKKQDQAARKIMRFLRRCRHRIKELKQTKELERRGLTT